MSALLKILRRMAHSPVKNYGGIPGLTSSLIGSPGPNGLVRLMESSRDHQEPITPHSHRFDFHCQVITGEVRNLIWTTDENYGDPFQVSVLQYEGQIGKYKRIVGEVKKWRLIPQIYRAGEEYGMAAEEVHSIFFSKGSVMLFFEGPTERDSSIILEPFVDGEAIPTFKVEPWMFKRN